MLYFTVIFHCPIQIIFDILRHKSLVLSEKFEENQMEIGGSNACLWKTHMDPDFTSLKKV